MRTFAALLVVPTLAIALDGPAMAQDAAPLSLSDALQAAMNGEFDRAVSTGEELARAGGLPVAINVGQIYTMIGAEAELRALWLQYPMPSGAGGNVPDLAGAELRPAAPEIRAASQGQRIVMLNEAHDQSRHRAYALTLLRDLRNAGFTHFAAETFVHGGEIVTEGAPTARSGTYTRDPLYGDLARQAAALGYELVAYERRQDQEEREQAQADNLWSLLSSDPDARVFVYAGYSHIEEAPVPPNDALWMAALLKDQYGLDPLTISQTHAMPGLTADQDSRTYQAVDALFDIEQSSVVELADGALLGSEGVDIWLFHPRERIDSETGRPDWLSMDGYRAPYEVTFTPMDERTLIRAFVQGEPGDAIPMDQILVPAGADSVTLMLPPGAYRLVRRTGDGETLSLGEGYL